MRPFALLQLVGPAVALHVGGDPARGVPRPVRGQRQPAPDRRGGQAGSLDDGEAVNPEVADAARRSATAPLTAEQVREQALAALAEEIRLMLDEGVVAEAQDIDLCLILGAGWPFHLGGITPYLDRTGVSERVTGPRFLPRRRHPPPGLGPGVTHVGEWPAGPEWVPSRGALPTRSSCADRPGGVGSRRR